METRREIVVLEENGLKVSVTERLCVDSYVTTLGGCVAARLEPLSVAIQIGDQPIRIVDLRV